MYTLYWHPYTSSLAPMAVLEELGVPFELYEVDYDGGECDKPEYRKLQPLGLIPALGLSDGSSMFESAAIVQYLSDRHGIGTLAPAQDDADRPRYLQWLYFMSDTIYPSYNRYYWPARYTSSPDGAEGVKDQVRETVLRQWKVVEDSLRQNGPWLLGSRFSACDIYLQMMTTWHETPTDLLGSFNRIRELAKSVVARDSCQRAIQRHNFTTGFENA